jgi:hypothetical protein
MKVAYAGNLFSKMFRSLAKGFAWLMVCWCQEKFLKDFDLMMSPNLAKSKLTARARPSIG